MQGFCHDGDHAVESAPQQLKEALNDIIEISGMYLAPEDLESDDNDRSLAEVEEYLRVAIQLIYDETSGRQAGDNPGSDKIH